VGNDKEGHIMTNKIDVKQQTGLAKEMPLFSFQREMNRMFDNFFRGWNEWPVARLESDTAFYPGVDVMETENEYRVKAELPGMDEKDVHVSLLQSTLTIKGEKKEETEDKGKDYHQIERHWGAFYRSIPLPTGIDGSKADASFKKGILTIKLPKTVDAKKETKEIPVHS
jgi:HSP20 family protein